MCISSEHSKMYTETEMNHETNIIFSVVKTLTVGNYFECETKTGRLNREIFLTRGFQGNTLTPSHMPCSSSVQFTLMESVE